MLDWNGLFGTAAVCWAWHTAQEKVLLRDSCAKVILAEWEKFPSDINLATCTHQRTTCGHGSKPGNTHGYECPWLIPVKTIIPEMQHSWWVRCGNNRGETWHGAQVHSLRHHNQTELCAIWWDWGSRQGMGGKEDSWATGARESGYRRNSPDGTLKRREDGNEGW